MRLQVLGCVAFLRIGRAVGVHQDACAGLVPRIALPWRAGDGGELSGMRRLTGPAMGICGEVAWVFFLAGGVLTGWLVGRWMGVCTVGSAVGKQRAREEGRLRGRMDMQVSKVCAESRVTCRKVCMDWVCVCAVNVNIA